MHECGQNDARSPSSARKKPKLCKTVAKMMQEGGHNDAKSGQNDARGENDAKKRSK